MNLLRKRSQSLNRTAPKPFDSRQPLPLSKRSKRNRCCRMYQSATPKTFDFFLGVEQDLERRETGLKV